MEDLGHKISSSVLSGHKKIADLISYEGPVLSHFRNEGNEDFIYYWIDQNDKLYRWLVFKITFSEIMHYLSSSISLRELILDEKIQYYFVADNNSANSNFENVFLLEKTELDHEYLPDVESYYHFDMPNVYQSLITTSELTQIEYLQILKENAIFIKFSDKNAVHKHILSIDDVASYLDKIKKSYNSYVEESFKKNFLSLFTNLADLNKAIDKLVGSLQLRVVDAKIASFGIGLSADIIMIDNDINKEVRSWTKTITSDYNSEVLELDYYDDDQVNYILKNYSPESRKNIFKPILDIYSNPEVEVSLSERSLNTVKKIKTPSKKIVKRLTDVPLLTKQEPKEKEFVTIAVEVDKGTDLSKVPRKVFSSQPLFEKRSDSIDLTKPTLVFENITITFKSPLLLRVDVKNGVHTVTSTQLSLAAEREDLSDAINVLSGMIYSYWLNFKSLSIPEYEYKDVQNPDPVILSIIDLIESIVEVK